MAWSVPATWSTSEVVLASKMNLHIRDNLIYLKGSPTFDGGIMVGTATGAGTGQIRAKGYTSFESISAESAYVGGTFLELKNTSASGRAYWLGSTGSGSGAGVGLLAFYDSTAGLFRAAMDANGNFGIGNTAPAGKLHVSAAGAVSGAGMAISSVAAVTSIQTIFAAGTVARGSWLFCLDRNNTGGATQLGSLLINPSGSSTYINNDTITIAVTAGGAVTAQRTVGTNGTHDIVILALFL